MSSKLYTTKLRVICNVVTTASLDWPWEYNGDASMVPPAGRLFWKFFDFMDDVKDI
jgi:hypothetical protein